MVCESGHGHVWVPTEIMGMIDSWGFGPPVQQLDEHNGHWTEKMDRSFVFSGMSSFLGWLLIPQTSLLTTVTALPMRSP